MKKLGFGFVALAAAALLSALAVPGCGTTDSEPPAVDLTGSWTMTSVLGATSCSNAFIVLLTNLGYTFGGTVDLTMIQEEEDLTVSASRLILNGTVSGNDFSVAGQTVLTANACAMTLTAGIDATAASDEETFVGESRYNVVTNGAADCLGVTNCVIQWTSSAEKES